MYAKNRYTRLFHDILEMDIVYAPISSGNAEDSRISPDNFNMALRGMNCIGGAISRDIKQTIIPYLDHVDASAAAIGSVNTVIVLRNTADQRAGKGGCHLVGYNTDASGFEEAIKKGIQSASKPVRKAVIYGYGGVSATVVHVLSSLGLEVFVTGRRPDEAVRRAAILGCKVWTEADQIPIDLFVNATPVTDKPLDQASGFLKCLNTCHLAFDHELKGAYLKQYCDENNITHISGMAMYYPQMEAQWKLFLGPLGIAADMVPVLLKEAEKAKEKPSL